MKYLGDIDYDYKDASSIEKYSQKLIGKTFREIIDDDNVMQLREEPAENIYNTDDNENKQNKGNLGQIIEERFFHYENNSDARPDFPDAGVELKVTPFKVNGSGKLTAKERLILTMIDYMNIVKETFESSHLWNKAKLILLIYYKYDQAKKYNLDYTIHYSRLFTPPQQDVMIIKHDFEVIQGKIRAGLAHELSEGDTLYLGAATKAATSRNRRKQPFSTVLAKPRAFSFKSSYMTYVLNTYIVPGKATYEPIIRDAAIPSFEDYVVERINRYRGKSIEDLASNFEIDISKKPKNLEAMLAYRMLGIKGNHAEEFVKANIVVKTIRVGKNGKIKENMSFPTFQFNELIKEEWDDSTFGNYLRDTRFLFVVYRFDEHDKLRLSGCRFWNIPYADLEDEVRLVWEKTRDTLLHIKAVKEIHNGKHYLSIFPRQTENPVSHVRPHGRDSKDTYPLPDGREYPKQSFWLNNDYILTIIEDV